MSEFIDVLQWITVNIFGEASILIGLIVLLGLVLQKKPLAEIVSSLLIFQPIWTEVFGLSSMNLTNMTTQRV